MNDADQAGAAPASRAVTIRPMHDTDASSVLAIYQEGIDTGHATFQHSAPTWAAWNAAHLDPCRLVAELNGRVVGWAALSGASTRPVYRGVAEESLYIATAARGLGAGRRLLKQLVTDSEAHGFWTLQAGIFPENKASISLHRSAGFRVLGTRERIGKMDYGPMGGQWRDVLLMERRSQSAGT